MEAVTACCSTLQSLGVLITRSLSDYFLKNAGIDLNILITSDYRRMKSDTFFYHMEEYHTTLFHTRPPENKYSSPPLLNKCLIVTDTDAEYQSIPITTNHVSLCNGELMQQSLTHKVHKQVNAAS